MEIKTHDIKQSEHLLAEKARNILKHQQKLATLRHQRDQLKKNRPVTKKAPLSYEESIEFGKQLERYEREIQTLEVKIQKVGRELNAFQLQAKKLLPVSEVKVKVSTGGSPCQTYCIEHRKSNDQSQFEEYLEVEQL